MDKNETKICIKCNEEKNILCFEFRKDTKKYRNICKNCNNMRRQSLQYKEWQKEYDRARSDDPNTWTWQIDHIVPHSNFKYLSMDCQEFRDCWALSNLRPYSSKLNIIEGNKRNKDYND